MAVLLLSCLLELLALVLTPVYAQVFLPPTPPISCDANSRGCTVQTFQGAWPHEKPCKAAMALYPSSEAELIQAVALASKTGSKVKVVSKGAHSFNKLVCPGGDEGILISTQNLNSYIRVNAASQTVTTDAGIMLRKLIDKIAEFGLTLPNTPFYGGVSVAGMISTGAHGSGNWGKGCSPHDYVVGMRLIVPATEEEGYAKVVDLSEGDEDLDAARLSLGVLGAISRVTFQLQPMFKRSVSVEVRDDERLEEEILEFGDRHEFGFATWYPAQRKVVYRAEDRVPVETPGNGAFNSLILETIEVKDVKDFFANWESLERKRDFQEFCLESKKANELFHSLGYGLLNNKRGTFDGYPVVGFNNLLQTCNPCEANELEILSINASSTFTMSNSPTMEQEHDQGVQLEKLVLSLDSKVFTCKWNSLFNPFVLIDVSISISISNIKEAILDIKRLRDINPSSMCKLEFAGGVILRFLGPSSAYLGEKGKSIMIEVFDRRYRATPPQTPMFAQDILEEIEQMLLTKFGGKPHWGKNRNFAFQNMHLHTPNMANFLEARKRFDPSGLFSSEWSNAMLGIGSLSTNPLYNYSFQDFHNHCALQGICICENDSHCNPLEQYFCRKGHIYDQAKVCRYEISHLKKKSTHTEL